MSDDSPQHEEQTDVADLLDHDIDDAFELLQAGFDRLLDISDQGDLCALGPARLIAFAQRFETHRSQLQAVDTGIVEAAHEERLDAYTCSRSLPIALADALRISRATAKARVARANQLMPEHAFSTGVASAQLPVLADAVRKGAVTSDQVQIIGTTMRTLGTNPQIGHEQARQAEQILVDQAASLGPEQLRVLAAGIDNALLPDGVLPREPIAAARRGLTIGPERKDGTHSITGSLTRSAYARLMSVLSPLAAPRPADDEMGPDPRTAEQRMHDALEDAMSRLLDSAGLPRSGGTPATVHVTIDADQLSAALAADNSAHGSDRFPVGTRGGAIWAPTRGVATTSFGDQLTFGELIQLADQARIIPTYLSSTKGIVAYGAQRRCATEGQTQALIARDKGCGFPGCDAPPEWCERHHVIPWYRGGPTDLNNLTLLCGYHHREFDKRGWRVVIHEGLPVWIPPTWIDRDQKPLINVRIHAGTAPMFSLDDLNTATGETADQDDGEALDELDPIEGLITLLAQHVTDEEREEFKFDVDTVLDSYVGPNAPANRHLEPVA